MLLKESEQFRVLLDRVNSVDGPTWMIVRQSRIPGNKSQANNVLHGFQAPDQDAALAEANRWMVENRQAVEDALQ